MGDATRRTWPACPPESRLGHPLPAGGLDREGDSEVGDQRVAALEQDVLRFDVAVDNPASVRVPQRIGHLAGNPERFGNRELPVASEPGAEGLAVDEGHHVKQEPRRLARLVERQDVGMLEVGGRPDFGQEPLGAEGRGELGVQHLDGDVAVVLQVVGEIDRGHPALPKLAVDPVALRQRRYQALVHFVSPLTVATQMSLWGSLRVK